MLQLPATVPTKYGYYTSSWIFNETNVIRATQKQAGYSYTLAGFEQAIFN
jgi:hypothetical protein